MFLLQFIENIYIISIFNGLIICKNDENLEFSVEYFIYLSLKALRYI